MAVNKPVALTGAALLAFIAGILAYGKAHNPPILPKPAFDTLTRKRVDTTKIHLLCFDPKARKDTINCPSIILPDAKGTIKKNIQPTDAQVTAYFDREFDSVIARIKFGMKEGDSVVIHATGTGRWPMTRYEARRYLDSLKAAHAAPPTVEFPE